MNTTSQRDCEFNCPWINTQLCARNMLGEEVWRTGRVSLGRLQGLKSQIYPHPLPPCLGANGRIADAAREDRDLPGWHAVLESVHRPEFDMV
jgi:hypothetical protein